MAYSLCEWFMQTYGDLQYKHCKFVMPTEADAQSITDNDDKAAEQKMLEEPKKSLPQLKQLLLMNAESALLQRPASAKNLKRKLVT